jgi:uncharacterized protein YkuJ
MQILPQPNAPTEIEDALQRLQRAIERLWQLAEDGGDTWDAHQAERALQRIREVLHACNANGTFSKR